jgi:MFS family permease
MYISMFLANIGLTGIYPILPFYVKSLDNRHVALWSGFIIGVPFLLSAILGPVWSKLAQAMGFRLILAIQAFLIGISLLLQSLANTPLELFVARVAGNIFGGIIASCFAYISISSPKEKLGRNLANGSIASTIGFIVGPALLGVAAARLGFKVAFYASAALLFACFFITLASLPRGGGNKFREIKFAELFSNLFGDVRHSRVQGAYLFVLVLFSLLSVPTTLEALLANDFLRDSRLASSWIGELSTLGAGLGLGLSYLISRFVDRVGYQPIFFATLVGSALSICGIGLSLTFSTFAVAFVINTILQCEFSTLANLMVIDRSSTESQGQAVVSTLSISKIGNFAGAAIAGSASELFPLGRIILFSGLGVLSLAWLIRKRKA